MRAHVIVFAFLAAACLAPTSSQCQCTVSEFCCLGACQPLGSRCGDGAPIDGGEDAGQDPCARRAMPDGGTAAVVGHCQANQRVSCLNGDITACAANRVCTERYDISTRLFVANCLPAGGEPCDELGAHCRGSSFFECATDVGRDPDGPLYTGHATLNCAELTPGSTCVEGAPLQCSKVTCNPSTTVDRCDNNVGTGCDSLRGSPYRDACPDGYKCFETAPLKPSTGHGTFCYPPGVISFEPPTAGNCAATRYVSCSGSDVRRVENCGFAWLERCDLRGMAGNRPAQECYSLPAPVVDADGGALIAVGCRRLDLPTCNQPDDTFLRCAGSDTLVSCQRGNEASESCFGRGCNASSGECN